MAKHKVSAQHHTFVKHAIPNMETYAIPTYTQFGYFPPLRGWNLDFCWNYMKGLGSELVEGIRAQHVLAAITLQFLAFGQ